MAIPEHDTMFTEEDDQLIFAQDSSNTGWFVGIVISLVLLAAGYLVHSADTPPAPGSAATGRPVLSAPAAT